MNKENKKKMLMALTAFQVVSSNVNAGESVTNSNFSCELDKLNREKFLSQNDFPGNYVSKSLSSFSTNLEMVKVLENNEQIGNYYLGKYPHKLPDLFKENACVEMSPVMNGIFENTNYKCDVTKLKREKFLSPNEFPGNYISKNLNSSSSNTDMIEELVKDEKIGSYFQNEYPHKLPELFEKGSCEMKKTFNGTLFFNSKFECRVSELNRERFLNTNDFPGNYIGWKLDSSSTNRAMLETLKNDFKMGKYFIEDYPHKLPMLFSENACRDRKLD